MRFLLIADIDDQTGEVIIKSGSDGIPDGETFLIVEAWLEHSKDSFKDPIKAGLA